MQNFIEIAISVILLFLLVSMIVTAINEIVARLFRLRGAFLFNAITSILGNKKLRDNFYSSGLIFSSSEAELSADRSWLNPLKWLNSLMPKSDKTGHPSYIPSETFSAALVQAVTRPEDGNVVTNTFDEIKTAIGALPPGRIKDVLVSALTQGANNVQELEASVANWYDNATLRLSGSYKRRQQSISFLIGLVLAVGLNINTLQFVTRVQADDEVRTAIVEQAVSLAGDKDALTPCESGDSGQQADLNAVDCYADQISLRLGDLNTLPIGWPDSQIASAERNPFEMSVSDAGIWINAIAGWLITALAVTLGAPFWFDLLTSFVNIRSAGPPPKNSGATGSRAPSADVPARAPTPDAAGADRQS